MSCFFFGKAQLMQKQSCTCWTNDGERNFLQSANLIESHKNYNYHKLASIFISNDFSCSFYYPDMELDVKKARENERERSAAIIARSALIKTVPDRNKFMHKSMGTFGWMEYMRNLFHCFTLQPLNEQFFILQVIQSIDCGGTKNLRSRIR